MIMAKRKKKILRRLSNLRIDEVSFVDRPANLKEFLFWKRLDDADIEKMDDEPYSLDVVFKTDGSRKGTKLKVNGAAVEDVRMFNLSFSPVSDNEPREIGKENRELRLGCYYEVGKKEPGEDGFKASTNFSLSKGLELAEVDPEAAEAAELVEPAKVADEDLEVLKSLSVDVPDEVDAELAKALAPHVKTIGLYAADLPAELSLAVQNLLTLACSTQEAVIEDGKVTKNEEPKTEDTTAEGAVAEPAAEVNSFELSADQLDKIAAAVVDKMAANAAEAAKVEPQPEPEAKPAEAVEDTSKPDEVEMSAEEMGQALAQTVVTAIQSVGKRN